MTRGREVSNVVVRLMTPPAEFPYSTELGPRMTSMRPTEPRSTLPGSVVPSAVVMGMPSWMRASPRSPKRGSGARMLRPMPPDRP